MNQGSKNQQQFDPQSPNNSTISTNELIFFIPSSELTNPSYKPDRIIESVDFMKYVTNPSNLQEPSQTTQGVGVNPNRQTSNIPPTRQLDPNSFLHKHSPLEDIDPRLLGSNMLPPSVPKSFEVNQTQSTGGEAIVEKTQPIQIKIHLVCFFLLYNPIFRDVYVDFIKIISQKLRRHDMGVSPFLNYIHEPTLLKILESFGEFTLEKIPDFKNCIQKIMNLSKAKEPEKYERTKHTTIRTILTRLKIDNQTNGSESKFTSEVSNSSESTNPEEINVEPYSPPKKIIESPLFIDLMKWVAQTMVKSYYIDLFERLTQKICSQTPQLQNQPINRSTDIVSHYQFISHGQLREIFANYVAKTIQHTGQDKMQWTKHFRIEFERVYNNMSQCVPKCIRFIPNKMDSRQKPAIYFNMDYYNECDSKFGSFE